ncbi:hypothetical protein SAMN02745134_00829 [Clostridium acidisoli DSM 12555]|uniref:Uncharacterized protein n=1 Tax=Clostridium acidisoli DSM 12555 TaxID=1121291 RepID=A0A1W1X675_9CLOT|nr:hypothetical protein [Clostridium acidisoli]SMC19432.1 hypothetical protein SAMN02745134_00829 [Clostridium acidisoli DSM 12555]
MKIKNSTFYNKKNVEIINPAKEITLGEYLKLKNDSIKTTKYLYLITTKYMYNGLSNFIFFYKLGRLFYHHTSDCEFKIDDVKLLPIYQIKIAKNFNKDVFKFDLEDQDENFINLTFTELEIILTFIEDNNTSIKYEQQVLNYVYKKLIDKYNKIEIVAKNNKNYIISENIQLETQQYISLYIYLKEQMNKIFYNSTSDGSIYNIRCIKEISTILNKIKKAIAKNEIRGYNLYTVKNDYNEKNDIFDL